VNSVTGVVSLLAAVGLGLMAGALLAEGALLVPFWRSQRPAEFLAWYKQHASMLQGFFGPLEVAAVVTTIIAAALQWFAHSSGWCCFAVASILGIGVLAVFPIYFQRANTSFRLGTIAIENVGAELARWARWHWGRTIAATAAFVAAVLGVAAV